MNIKIRTINTQRRVSADSFEELDQKIRDLFKTEKYQLFSDLEKTKPLKEIVDNQTIYMEYETGEAKAYKPEFTCTHSPDAVCSKCATLDPLERKTEPGIPTKYLSYLSYLELLKDKGKVEEEYDYKPKVCKDHSSKTKCSKCMEKQITLVSQIYRKVDYVEFDNQCSMENFISQWRDSGRQKIGLLIGRHKDHPDIPLGKKAVVSCIWEIEQENYPDGLALDEIPERFISGEMKILGIVYTELAYKNGKTESYKRNYGYFVSTLELMLAYAARKRTNLSEFVSIFITINDEGSIVPQAFMISEQFYALMDANILVPTTDPKHFFTKRDIVYFTINEYDIKVSAKANPLVPVDYFIVNCEIGFRDNPVFTNNEYIKRPTPRKLSAYFNGDFSLEKFQNFYILFALEKYVPNCLEQLFNAAIKNDESTFSQLMDDAEFSEFKNLLSKFQEKKWNCIACTFLNESYASSCRICGENKTA